MIKGEKRRDHREITGKSQAATRVIYLIKSLPKEIVSGGTVISYSSHSFWEILAGTLTSFRQKVPLQTFSDTMRLRLLKLLAGFLVSVGSVRADGQAIVNAIASIQTGTLNISATVTAWDGQLVNTKPLWQASSALLDVIKHGKQVANRSEKLTMQEAMRIKEAAQDLSGNMTLTFDALVGVKSKFANAWLTGAVVLNLRQADEGVGQFVHAVVNKLPKLGVAPGKKFAKQTHASFTKIIGLIMAEE